MKRPGISLNLTTSRLLAELRRFTALSTFYNPVDLERSN